MKLYFLHFFSKREIFRTIVVLFFQQSVSCRLDFRNDPDPILTQFKLN